MKYTYLGRTGMKVSRLCLGTMNFGPYTEEKEAFRIMDKALDAGINFFDTADVYGSTGHKGWTEEIIGRWFAQGGGRREKVILATKVFGDMEDENTGPNSRSGLSAYKIRINIEGSLKRLKTDHIELYQMHHIDRNTSWEEAWGVFENLVDQGKAFYIGSSNFAGWHLMQAQAAAAKRNFLGLVSEQHKYNLLCRLPELEVLPAAEELGIGIIAWSPLAGGVLGRNIHSAVKGVRSEQRVANISLKEHAQLEEYSKICSEISETPENETSVALAWLLANPAMTAPIIGPRTEKQLEESLKAIELKLPEDVMQKLDKIFPGPGGRAPEAYSW